MSYNWLNIFYQAIFQVRLVSLLICKCFLIYFTDYNKSRINDYSVKFYWINKIKKAFKLVFYAIYSFIFKIQYDLAFDI